MSVQRRNFPGSFKREAVDRVASSGLSVGAVARELGLHETVLRRWMTQFGVQATGTSRRPTTQASSPSPSDLAAELARLRRENSRLRMERDILKKAALIFGAASR
ncbi:transposase [Brevundimonas sp. SORGH_AS 993]|nr:transposase [Brevundimonas sp. SORGH_AS_0993]